MKKLFVLAAAVVLVFGMTPRTWAYADFDIGATLRINTFWRFEDLGDQATGVEDDITTFILERPSSSALMFKTTVGDVDGYVELGLGEGVSLRKAYANWDLGGGSSLLFGKDSSTFTSAGIAALKGQAFGDIDLSKQNMIRYSLASETWTLRLEAQDTIQGYTGTGLSGTYNREDIIPMLIANVTFKPIEGLTVTPNILYQMYELVGATSGVKDVDVDTWIVGLDAGYSFDFASISVVGWFG
jgi:hypothetical protein